MNNKNINELRRLQDAGWNVDSSPAVRFNGGSETIAHFLSKACTAYIARSFGYCVDTEVESDHGEIDVLLYAHDKLNRAVECETAPDPTVIADKKARYVDSTQAINEIHVIDVTALPANLLDMRDRIQSELGLY